MGREEYQWMGEDTRPDQDGDLKLYQSVISCDIFGSKHMGLQSIFQIAPDWPFLKPGDPLSRAIFPKKSGGDLTGEQIIDDIFILLLDDIARSAQQRLIFSGLDSLRMFLRNSGGRSHYILPR